MPTKLLRLLQLLAFQIGREGFGGGIGNPTRHEQEHGLNATSTCWKRLMLCIAVAVSAAISARRYPRADAIIFMTMALGTG